MNFSFGTYVAGNIRKSTHCRLNIFYLFPFASIFGLSFDCKPSKPSILGHFSHRNDSTMSHILFHYNLSFNVKSAQINFRSYHCKFYYYLEKRVRSSVFLRYLTKEEPNVTKLLFEIIFWGFSFQSFLAI